jgi:hypothetical protein
MFRKMGVSFMPVLTPRKTILLGDECVRQEAEDDSDNREDE